MKTPVSAKFYLVAVLFIAFLGNLQAGRMIWPRQPRLSEAHESLTRAAAQVEKAKATPAAEHLVNAKIQLAAAKNSLEEAKKNKGSSRLVAIKAIDEALKAIDDSKSDPTQLDKAGASITKALKEVSDSAKAGS